MVSRKRKERFKKQRMRKIIPFILIIVIVFANLFAPISVGWENKKVEVKGNVIQAEPPISGEYNFEIKPIIEKTNNSVEIQVEISSDSETFKSLLGGASYLYLGIEITDQNGHPVKDEKGHSLDQERLLSALRKNGKDDVKVIIKGLKALTNYNIKLTIKESFINIADEYSLPVFTTLYTSSNYPFTTNDDSNTDLVSIGEIDGVEMVNNDPMPECGLGGLTGGGSIGGCVAQVLYYLFFIPTSFLFAVAGTFFDWTFNYSVQSASYKSTFVVQGWNIVRDFCNMFFIFVLLYIAFKTILNLGGSKTKEMIINVIVIGLLINFSLFTTRIIIDASNILARVFYNSDTIKITEVDRDFNIPNMIKKPSETGIIPMSSALVNKVNPQSIIINAKGIDSIPDKGGQTKDDRSKNGNGVTTTTFIVVTLLASAINVVGFIVFLTVGMIFVVRVVGLWLAMILSPIAFFSYTVPEMKSWGTVGATNWWPETLKLAFLAPVFMFFMYLILQFLDIGMGILDTADKGVLGWLISVLVPFAFIMVLLMKAKSIAVKMAGEMGAAVAKAGSTVGGLALGAGVGLGALAMRGTAGKWMGNVANSEKLKADAEKGGFTGWQAKMRLKTASGISKSSFDARNTMLGKEAQSKLGIDATKGPKFIKPAEGGYVGAQERKAKRIEEMDKLTKPTATVVNQQNKGAREWNDKYMDEMIKAKNITEGAGLVWNEKNFREKYERGKVSIEDDKGKEIYSTKGTPRAQTADEIERQRISDKASRLEYGDDYIEKRNKEKARLGLDFNEYQWRKEQLEKGGKAGGIDRKNDLDEREEKLVQEYRKQGTAEKVPLNPIEKDRVEKTKEKAEKSLAHTNEELTKITTSLETIAKNQKVKDGVDGVRKEHVMAEIILPNQEAIIKHEATIAQKTSALNKNPYNIKAKDDLIKAQTAKKALENEIDDAKSLLANKEKYENLKIQQNETIKQQDDKLLNR